MLKLSNGPERKYDYCGACSFYLGAVIMTLVCQALAGVVSAALAKSHPDISSNGDFATAFMIIVQVVNLAFIVVYSKLNRYKPNFAFVRHGKTGRSVTPSVFIVPVLAAALLMVCMYLPTVWYGYFTRYALHVPPDFGSVNLDTKSSVAMIVIASVFLAPVCEETIYRGVLFNGLKSERTTLNAVMLSALAFMLMHMSPVQVVFQFSLGVASAYMMHRSERLLPSVIMHATANALALVMELTSFSSVLGGCVGWLTSNVAAAVFITLGLFIGGGAALYALIRFGFELPAVFKRIKNGRDAEAEGDAADGNSEVENKPDGNTVETLKDEILTAARKKDGTFRYWVGIAICGVLLVINLVVSIV